MGSCGLIEASHTRTHLTNSFLPYAKYLIPTSHVSSVFHFLYFCISHSQQWAQRSHTPHTHQQIDTPPTGKSQQTPQHQIPILPPTRGCHNTHFAGLGRWVRVTASVGSTSPHEPTFQKPIFSIASSRNTKYTRAVFISREIIVLPQFFKIAFGGGLGWARRAHTCSNPNPANSQDR